MLSQIAIAATLVSKVLAYDYIGCFSRPEVLNGQVGEYQGLFPWDCPTHCAELGNIYSYHYARWRGSAGLDEWCLCTDAPPDFQYIEDGWDNCNPGDFLDPGDVSVTASVAPFTFTYCHESPNTLELSTPVSTVFECFAHCSTFKYARMYYNAGESQGNCFCYATDDLWANSPFTTCNIGDWYIFEQPV